MKLMTQVLFGALMIAMVPNVYAGKLGARMANQHHRIHEGVKNGTMTQEEAKADRQNIRAVRQERREMRKANGGKLTAENRKELNQQLNENSKTIHNEKHDGVNGAAPAAPAAGQ